ncbi:MAG: hypothetical protein GY809_01430, partial [Planctomycetes bacterium]|nr:hypothetical protein [Planctomycetota bacterium]
GRGELVLKGKTFPLVAGAVFAYGPDIPHVITSDPKDRLVKYFVDFQGPRALPLLDTYAPHPGEVVRAIFRAPSRRPMAYRQTPFDTDDNPSRQRPGETGRRI